LLLKPLSYREPGQLIFIREVVPPLAHIYPTMPVNIRHFRFWREQTRSFHSLAAISWGNETLMGGAEPEAVGSVAVTANPFDCPMTEPCTSITFVPT
jgi:hypothetical protein